MKPITLSITVLFAAALLARADEVALITFKSGKDKQLQRVALEFYEGDAPQTVASFKKLAKKGFYNGLAVHRAFPHALIQTGDPLTKDKDRTKVGTGGPGFTIVPEIHRKHTKGAVAAARLPDNLNPSRVSNGSQFYICLTPQPTFDGQYTVFGNVIYGLDVLDGLSTMTVDTNDYPLERIEVKSIKIMPREKLPAAPEPVVVNPAVGKPAPKKKSWWQIFG